MRHATKGRRGRKDPMSGKHLSAPGGLEGVAVMRDFRRAHGALPDDRDHVEARRLLEQPELLEKGQRQPCKLRLLMQVHCFVRLTRRIRTARFDFDKYN